MAHLPLAGTVVVTGNRPLLDAIERADIRANVSLLGEGTEMPPLTSTWDAACLSSLAEGFPNVIGEAMACGVPGIATDTGDTKRIVGGCGFVVPVRSPEAFANAVLSLASLDRSRRALLGEATRRIKSEYSLSNVAPQFDDLHEASQRH